MATLYISPTGSGLKDGSSAANAGTLSNLNSFITAAGAGGQVLLLADQGAYQQSTYLNINHGGTADGSVTIRGVDSAGNSMAAEIVGSRADNWTPGQAEGSELFRLTGGASNLNFQDLSISNVGNGAFRAGSDISNISISNVDAHNVTRFFEDYVSGAATTASVTGLTIQNVNIEGYSKGAIDLSYNSSNIVIKDVVADSQGQNGGLFVVGVHLTDTVHDVTLDTVTMKNNNGNGTDGQYWNGDGFTTENGVYNITFKDTVSAGNTDAGYDLKSSNTTLINTVAIGNDENYRLWSDSITVTNGVSLDPTHNGGTGEMAHVWMADGAVATLDNFTFSDSGALATLFKLTQTGATLYLANTSIPDVYMPLIKMYNGSTVQVLQDGVPVLLGATPPSVTPPAVTPPPPVDHAPTDIIFDGGTVQENSLGGTVVATLAAVDPDAGNTHTYALSGVGADKFDIVGDTIVVKQGALIDYEQQTSYTLTVTATDQDGLSVSKDLQVGVTDVVETGTKGNDYMAGGLGADTLAGGAGNDTYVVNAVGDTVVELAGQGNADTVLASVASYTLGDYVENLTYTGSGDFIGWGNSAANVINAGAGNDELHGGSGNDTINGGDGSDTIYGDNGRDVIHGGEGSDVIFGGNDADTIWGDNGDDQISGGQGCDTIYGGDGNDYIDGGTEADTMVGGTGDDVYIVDNKGDVVVENANEGTDTVRTALSYTLGDNVENLVLTGTNNASGTGNALNNVITGNDGNNTLSGGAGNDVLDGGKGKDTLIGGNGDDTYLFGRGSGQDTIDNSHTDSGKDVLQFKEGISAQDLWFRHDHNDLVISVVGTGDSVRLVGWYTDDNHKVDQIDLNDGTHIDAGQVQQVVDAMAHASAAAPSSLNNLTHVAHDAVVAVVAASFH